MTHTATSWMPEHELRRHIASAKRIVVKIGSSSLTGKDFRVDPQRINRIVDCLYAR
ncbi:glutamate 5-kinase, partial [Bacteroides thetaiotaomicron]|nr:glutamate 5-kinase [Bacteroides thetaiotaomicron]